MTTKRRVCDSFCPSQCARARDPAPKCDFGCRDETRTTHDDAKTRRAARTLERDVTFGLHLINPLDSCARHRTACGVYPLNPALDENAHEGTNEHDTGGGWKSPEFELEFAPARRERDED